MSTITVAGAGIALHKLLGPSLDYFGERLGNVSQRATENLADIFSRAQAKLGREIEEEGGVNVRVVNEVVRDGAFAEDVVARDYYGGILASSRGPALVDDRGVQHANLVRLLSVFQLRLHYLFYRELRRCIVKSGARYPLVEPRDRRALTVFIPSSTFVALLPEGTSREQAHGLAVHSVAGLGARSLIQQEWGVGLDDPSSLKELCPLAPDGPGLILSPSLLGIELYLWGTGEGRRTAEEFAGAAEFPLPAPVLGITGECCIVGSPPPSGKSRKA